MTPQQAIDLLDQASQQAQGDRNFHVQLIDAVRLLRSLVNKEIQ